jgi:hypothetical protein
MTTVRKLVDHMEELAQIDQNKKTKKYNRQQRKNQARNKTRKIAL